MKHISLIYPLSSAILMVQTAAKGGFEALRAFALTRESPTVLSAYNQEKKTFQEFLNQVASCCWMGQDYFRMWLGDENLALKKQELNHLNDLTDGVYYLELMGFESHYWIWIINQDDLWYAGTYGGVRALSVKKFKKEEYYQRFLSAISGSMTDYAYVFQVTPCVKEVGYQSITYMKSNRYS